MRIKCSPAQAPAVKKPFNPGDPAMNTLPRCLKVLPALVLAVWVSAVGAQPRTTDGVVTDEKGMSLYVWDNDLTVPGKSACTGPCTLTWMPMLAQKGAQA